MHALIQGLSSQLNIDIIIAHAVIARTGTEPERDIVGNEP